MVTVSQKELQRVKVIENAVDGRLSVSEAARLLQLSERQVQRLKRRFCPRLRGLGASRQSWTAHALGSACSPAPDDPGVGPRQVSGLQRFSSLRETALCRELGGQPRDRAPHPARRQAGLPAEAATPPVTRPPRAISALCTPCSPPRASPSAFTAIATASFSATMPTGPWPNNSPVNSAPPIWDGLWRNSAFNRSPPTLPRPKAASSASGASARIAWSTNSRLAQACDLDSANQVL